MEPVEKIRPPAVAGSWYPGDAEALAAGMDRLLAEAAQKPPPGETAPIRAVLVPHAGTRFSGPTAAAALAALSGKGYSRVLVLGPAHRKAFDGLSVPGGFSHYQTPLGNIPLDGAAMEKLLADGLVNAVPGAHDREHSIEMTLPLLQRALAPGWRLLPVLVGDLDRQGFARAAAVLKPLLDAETLLVVSGDFTHYGPNYQYLPFPPDRQLPERIKALDMGALEKITARDADGLADHVQKTGLNACAFGPAAILAHLLRPESTASLVQYTTSGALTGDYRNSVSYLGVRFSDPAPLAGAPDPAPPPAADEGGLSDSDMALLHRMARHAVTLATTRGPGAVTEAEMAGRFTIPDHLRQPGGAFVTLKAGEDLRGCIGHIKPIKPLYRSVVENAVNAALHDRRFRPVTSRELAHLSLEVSVLSPLRPIASHDDYQVARHGVVLSKGGRQAVYLPEVAREQGWDKATTLGHLSRKAGLSEDAWKSGSRFEVFTSQALTAPIIPAADPAP